MALPGWCLILASLAFVLAAAAWWNSFRVVKLLRSRSVRSLVELSALVTEVQSGLESLSRSQAKLSSKVQMRETRAKQANQPSELSELSGDAWRKAARAKFIRPGLPVQHGE